MGDKEGARLAEEMRPGDQIIVERTNEVCDILEINESNEEEIFVQVPSFEVARHIAFGQLKPGGKVWVRDELTPNVTKPY